MAAIAGAWAGGHGAMSALLGGGVNVAAGVVYAFLLGIGLRARPVPDAGTSLVAMLRAEAAKILVIVGGLGWRCRRTGTLSRRRSSRRSWSP